MQNELPIDPPFQKRGERLLVVTVLIVILLLTIGFFPLRFERKSIIAKIPATETDTSFIIDELYNKTSDIDLLLLGPCTIWWQIYTPYLQESLSKKYHRQAEVITLGFNHFGSDIMYLILKDLLKKRKVKNLLLALPKIEDLYPFPHKNAVGWWIYPNDLEDVSGLSFGGYARIIGLNLFTSLYRSTLSFSGPNTPLVQNPELGFHFSRSRERVSKKILSHLSETENLVKVVSLNETNLDLQTPLSKDWSKFYKLMLEMTQQQNINVIFVDSPHAVEFTSEEKTIPGNFPEVVGQQLPVVATNFKNWQNSLPTELQRKIYSGHNLTVTGAQLFTHLIHPYIVELAK